MNESGDATGLDPPGLPLLILQALNPTSGQHRQEQESENNQGHQKQKHLHNEANYRLITLVGIRVATPLLANL